MKKILLIVIVITLGYAKGYSQQLMQSNSVSFTSAVVKVGEVKRLDRATSKSDTLLKNSVLKMDSDFFKQKNGSTPEHQADTKDLSDKIKTLQKDIKKSNAEKLVLYGQYVDLIIEKYTGYIKALDIELDTYKKGIGDDRKKAVDTFDKVINSHVTQDKPLTSSQVSQISNQGYAIENKLNDVVIPQRNAINNLLQDLKQLKADLKQYQTIEAIIYAKAAEKVKLLDQTAVKFTDTKKGFVDEYNSYVDAFNTYIDALNVLIKKIDNDGTTQAPDAEALSALGGINKIFGDHGAVIPNVSIVGQKKFVATEQSSIYGEVKLIIAGADDDKKNPGVNKLFIPEASTLGFMTDFTFGFIGADKKPIFNSDYNHYEQKLSINLGVYYLGKKLQPDTLTSFNTTVFHVKLGFEYIIIPHAISAYFNTNQLLVVTNIKTFEKYYPDAKRIRSFTSFGIQSYLDLNDKKDFHLLINLGFVNVNNDVNSWMQTSDSVIPTVKLSLVKSFGF